MMDLSFLMGQNKKSLRVFLALVTTDISILNSHLKYLKPPWIFWIQRSDLVTVKNWIPCKSFIKPICNFQYIHRNSAHDASVFKGFINGECVGHLRITNDPSNIKMILQDFKGHVSKRDYSEKKINLIIDEISGKENACWVKKKKKQYSNIHMSWLNNSTPASKD